MENQNTEKEVKREDQETQEEHACCKEDCSKESCDETIISGETCEGDTLKKEIDLLKQKLTEVEGLRIRLMADFENYKKRSVKDRETILKFANEELLLSLLPVMDNMELAMKSVKEEEKEGSVYKGVEMVYAQLKDVLEKNGLTEIKAEGAEFDPNLHDAVMRGSAEGVPDNMILEVLRKGYQLEGRVIRPSMVKVSVS